MGDIQQTADQYARDEESDCLPTFDELLDCNQHLLYHGIMVKMNGESDAPPASPSVGDGGRKRLPSVPEPGSPGATRTSNPGLHSPRSVHSYGPFFMEYSLLAEYNQIQKQKLPGVYIIPSARSPRVWFGVLFIRQGIYQEGVFKFTLNVPENYPDGECPGVTFDHPVFHPVIHPVTGELDVKRAFQKWRRNVNHLWQVLLYVRRVFYKIDTKTPSNPEAAVLYEKDLDLYKSRVVESVASCKKKLNDPPKTDDPHEIRFSEYDETIHDSAKKQMLQPKEMNPHDESNKNAQISGLSWMKKGSNEIFSRDDCPSL